MICPTAALALLATIPAQLTTLQSSIADLAKLIPTGQFYRYSGIFSHAIQTASYMVVLSTFLEHETVPSKDQVSNALGSQLDSACAAPRPALALGPSSAQGRGRLRS